MIDFTRHTHYSDPGEHAALLDKLPTDLPALSAIARNVIEHYRASEADLPASSRDDIHLRWLSAILDTDQLRHGRPLDSPREKAERAQGCCRDHSLFCVGALRQHGVPARTLIGFTDYFTDDDFGGDHVIVESWNGSRWVRFDPELSGPQRTVDDPMDIPAGPGSPFQTAAEVWQGIRSGVLDPDRFGVAPGSPLSGAWFVQNYVLMQLAHFHGDELLLWDTWGAMATPDEPRQEESELVDRIAGLLTAAQDPADPASDSEAAKELTALYRSDDRLHPGSQVLRLSPHGEEPMNDPVGPRDS